MRTVSEIRAAGPAWMTESEFYWLCRLAAASVSGGTDDEWCPGHGSFSQRRLKSDCVICRGEYIPKQTVSAGAGGVMWTDAEREAMSHPLRQPPMVGEHKLYDAVLSDGRKTRRCSECPYWELADSAGAGQSEDEADLLKWAQTPHFQLGQSERQAQVERVLLARREAGAGQAPADTIKDALRDVESIAKEIRDGVVPRTMEVQRARMWDRDPESWTRYERKLAESVLAALAAVRTLEEQT